MVLAFRDLASVSLRYGLQILCKWLSHRTLGNFALENLFALHSRYYCLDSALPISWRSFPSRLSINPLALNPSRRHPLHCCPSALSNGNLIVSLTSLSQDALVAPHSINGNYSAWHTGPCPPVQPCLLPFPLSHFMLQNLDLLETGSVPLSLPTCFICSPYLRCSPSFLAPENSYLSLSLRLPIYVCSHSCLPQESGIIFHVLSICMVCKTPLS